MNDRPGKRIDKWQWERHAFRRRQKISAAFIASYWLYPASDQHATLYIIPYLARGDAAFPDDLSQFDCEDRGIGKFLKNRCLSHLPARCSWRAGSFIKYCDRMLTLEASAPVRLPQAPEPRWLGTYLTSAA